MRRSILPLGILGLLTMFALASLGKSQQPQPRPGVDPDNPIEVQPRGAIHEAFAQPFDGKAQPGPLVPKEPPPPIPEEPPEQRPEGDNVQWFSGYWAWDAQLGDFVWISGVHRVPPQERTFVPGYWQQTPEGWRWVHGFWADAKQQAIPYTPEPPAPLDNSPSMPPPDDDSVYIPGSWNYRDDRFVWRPGYYAPAQLGRMWTPPRFLWTPGGYIFISGFWDCPLEDRGLAYANVYFTRPLWRDPSWRYRPSLVISLGSFWDSTFVMDSQFYCGDYYDPFYSRLGYRPWYTGRGRYDPIFTYHGWRHHRHNPNWVAGVQQTFAGRSAGRLAAPTLAVTPLNKVQGARLVQTTPAQVQSQQQFVQDTRQRAVNRQQLDAAWANRGTSPSVITTRSVNTSPTPAPANASRPLPTPTTPSFDPRTIIASPSIAPASPAPRITTTAPPPRIVSPVVPRVATPSPKLPSVTTTAPRIVSSPPPPPVVRSTPASSPPIVTQAPRVTTTAPRIANSPPPVVRSAPAGSPPPRPAPSMSTHRPSSSPPARATSSAPASHGGGSSHKATTQKRP